MTAYYVKTSFQKSKMYIVMVYQLTNITTKLFIFSVQITNFFFFFLSWEFTGNLFYSLGNKITMMTFCIANIIALKIQYNMIFFFFYGALLEWNQLKSNQIITLY